MQFKLSNPNPLLPNRNRILYLIALLIVIGAGLSSRKFSTYLPEIINTYLGDALWALMIYLLVATFFTNKKIKTVASISLLFCYTIEMSQLYHAPWIDDIRNTTLGGLVLGFGFLWTDIVAYTLGIGFGVILEWLIYYNKKTFI